MQNDCQLHLVIPGLCGPLAETESLKAEKSLFPWLSMLSKAGCKVASDKVNDVVAGLVDLEMTAGFPAAAFALIAEGRYDKSKHYMFADPVNLHADMDHAVLTSCHDLGISHKDASAILDSLNQHFGQDGFEFIMLSRDQWVIASERSISLHTTDLTDAIGRNVNFLLPSGDDSAYWKQVLTEAQMIMHSHACNADRESQAMAPLNSLWFHGSGDPGRYEKKNTVSLCSDSQIYKGLANYTGNDFLSIPGDCRSYSEFLLQSRHGMNILHLGALEYLVNYTDVRPWLEQLQQTLDNWVYPLLRFSHNNGVRVSIHPCDGKAYEFSRYDFLKFWRRPKKLEHYIGSY